MDKPITDRRKMDLKLRGYRGSNKVLELAGVKKAFDAHRVFDGLNEIIWHGERVGLIGPNGAGKSVLIRMILGEELPDVGEIKLGLSVTVGYYAQEHETLDFEQKVIDVVRFTGNMSDSKAMALLSKYLFTYEQAQGLVKNLSGGERSRLQLALVVLSGANFLLLDEPTNNLDIAAAQVLEAALEDFEGTVLIISHDRYFLDRAVERLLEIRDRHFENHLGGYSEYLEKRGS
jgi:ATP-binding cassette subfamily F protein 3